ncbi:hypothetical protein [Propylenella binzhouense]|uniref:Uncharacterized protein n=1 Tax=Propylenella binzhouense TaxID=2555902 RepID=A0A964T6W8_9HYPH|nr:hypothetical protein [Propylenella binzhouense]MYZ49530.1 hypothetical protein [Propylenella binzhouense]
MFGSRAKTYASALLALGLLVPTFGSAALAAHDTKAAPAGVSVGGGKTSASEPRTAHAPGRATGVHTYSYPFCPVGNYWELEREGGDTIVLPCQGTRD